jgi:hypothetical protein
MGDIHAVVITDAGESLRRHPNRGWVALVLDPTRTFMPHQTTVAAAVRGWVTRGQAALTFVQPPGQRGPAASHRSTRLEAVIAEFRGDRPEPRKE